MLNSEERIQALQWAKNGATFMFMPHQKLINMIVLDAPGTKDINKTLKYTLLQNKPIRMETKMIVDYCLGTLDSKNSWVLDHGDIKVIPPQFETKKKENDNE